MTRDIIIDAATGGGAICLPFWVQSLNAVAQEALVIGGVILLALRIALAFQAWRRRSPEAQSGSDDLGNGGTP